MIIRRLARPLLAAIFISGGIGCFKAPEYHEKAAKKLLEKTGSPESFPVDAATLVKVDGVVKLGAGALFALGRFPRLSALLLAGTLIPTTAAGHPFWEYTDPGERAGQRIHFLKNLGLFGGLLLAVVDTGGKPSLGWRARRSAKKLRKQTTRAVSGARIVADRG